MAELVGTVLLCITELPANLGGNAESPWHAWVQDIVYPTLGIHADIIFQSFCLDLKSKRWKHFVVVMPMHHVSHIFAPDISLFVYFCPM